MLIIWYVNDYMSQTYIKLTLNTQPCTSYWIFRFCLLGINKMEKGCHII